MIRDLTIFDYTAYRTIPVATKERKHILPGYRTDIIVTSQIQHTQRVSDVPSRGDERLTWPRVVTTPRKKRQREVTPNILYLCAIHCRTSRVVLPYWEKNRRTFHRGRRLILQLVSPYLTQIHDPLLEIMPSLCRRCINMCLSTRYKSYKKR